MNDTPNEIHWQKGDIVCHDADAKCDEMLMVVIGYTKDGLCKTQYVDKQKHSRQVYKNDIRFLHDPRRPDIRARWKPQRPSRDEQELERLVRNYSQPPKPVAEVEIAHAVEILDALSQHPGEWIALNHGAEVSDELLVAWLLKSLGYNGAELYTTWDAENGKNIYLMRTTGQYEGEIEVT